MERQLLKLLEGTEAAVQHSREVLTAMRIPNKSDFQSLSQNKDSEKLGQGDSELLAASVQIGIAVQNPLPSRCKVQDYLNLP